jgi:prephenate dehydrogenase
MKIGVVGLGLIGGSIARGLVSANQGGYEVIVFDTDAAVREHALAEGFAVASSVEKIQESADLVFLATPIGATLNLLGGFGAGAPVLTDVCSVKRSIMQAARESNLSRFIGGHPMAGSHRAGWSAGSESLLRGAVWALVLDEHTDTNAWAQVAQLVLALGARVAPVTAAAHDQAVGGVSHAAHVVAAAYVNSLNASTPMPLALTLAAGSFKDVTRIMLSPEERTSEILIDNGDDAAQASEAVGVELERLTKMLAARDELGVREELAHAGEIRRRYDRLMASQAQKGHLVDAPSVSELVEALRPFVDTGSLVADITLVANSTDTDGEAELWRAVVLEPNFGSEL